MYGVADGMDGSEFVYSAGDPVSPIGPDLKKQDDWWFRYILPCRLRRALS